MTQLPTDSSPSLSVLRIYLRRRGSTPGRGFWGRLFGLSLSHDLARRALEAFVAANQDELADAVLLRLDGTRVTLCGASA